MVHLPVRGEGKGGQGDDRLRQERLRKARRQKAGKVSIADPPAVVRIARQAPHEGVDQFAVRPKGEHRTERGAVEDSDGANTEPHLGSPFHQKLARIAGLQKRKVPRVGPIERADRLIGGDHEEVERGVRRKRVAGGVKRCGKLLAGGDEFKVVAFAMVGVEATAKRSPPLGHMEERLQRIAAAGRGIAVGGQYRIGLVACRQRREPLGDHLQAHRLARIEPHAAPLARPERRGGKRHPLAGALVHLRPRKAQRQTLGRIGEHAAVEPLVRIERCCARHHIGDKTARLPLAGDRRHRARDLRMGLKRRFDLTKLDAVAAHLHLAIFPAQELDEPVAAVPAQVAGLVKPAKLRVVDKARGGAGGIAPVAAGQPLARDEQAARHPVRHRRQAMVEDMIGLRRERPAVGNGAPVRMEGVGGHDVGPDGRLGRPAEGLHTHPGAMA